jgi:glyoxylase I family protein
MSIFNKSANKNFPKVDHLTLTVKDFAKSKSFYTELFVHYLGSRVEIDDSDLFGIMFENGFLFELREEYPEFTNSKFNRYQVGLHHFALEFENKKTIDNIYQKLLALKAKILDAPAFYQEYTEGYYAVYWQDLNGFKMEFMCYEKITKI